MLYLADPKLMGTQPFGWVPLHPILVDAKAMEVSYRHGKVYPGQTFEAHGELRRNPPRWATPLDDEAKAATEAQRQRDIASGRINGRDLRRRQALLQREHRALVAAVPGAAPAKVADAEEIAQLKAQLAATQAELAKARSGTGSPGSPSTGGAGDPAAPPVPGPNPPPARPAAAAGGVSDEPTWPGKPAASGKPGS